VLPSHRRGSEKMKQTDNHKERNDHVDILWWYIDI
jgi:hypothetical protein